MPAVIGWGLGFVALITDLVADFPGDAWGWLWLFGLPVIPLGALAWRAHGVWPPIRWMLRLPLSTLIVAALVNAPPVEHRAGTEGIHMEGKTVIIAADLGGGLNLGTITSAGLAAIITAFCIFYLKNGGETRWVKWVKTEHLMIFGFAASSFYEAAGWNGPSDIIIKLTGKWAESWGPGALAWIILLFMLLRKHSDRRAVIGGFASSTLFAAAGGSWAWPETTLTTLAQAVGLAR
ncbi:hypothetical protein [Streptomyces sp. NBC_01304]|uniref:hypothetical protein n=1 Tax=Streptomyces sp. NBC_01304 TaxID=2903818 RepID=UPI002E14B4CC|nr:hypothetical protein OG430_48225 [Streptomyces sp. NBC_01304]